MQAAPLANALATSATGKARAVLRLRSINALALLTCATVARAGSTPSSAPGGDEQRVSVVGQDDAAIGHFARIGRIEQRVPRGRRAADTLVGLFGVVDEASRIPAERKRVGAADVIGGELGERRGANRGEVGQTRLVERGKVAGDDLARQRRA